ncbi:MAG: RHS repeat domain-containing protein, partial [Bacteroidales bacterium]
MNTAETYSRTNPTIFYGGEFCCENSLHNIVSKKQHITQTDIAFDGDLMAGYELSYNYSSDKPHQLANIEDVNYRTADSTAVASNTKNLSNAYHYDNNGNLVYVNTSDTVQSQIKERKLSWDEENRLRAICDNGYVSSYFYDAAGERTVKLHGSGEGIHVNSAFSGGYTDNQNYTLYVSAYMVLNQGGQYTKHIYIGDQRIVSKLGDVGSFGVDPRREEYAGTNVAGTSVPDYKSKYISLQEVIKDTYTFFEVDYYGVDNDDYVAGAGFCCDDASPQLKSIPTTGDAYEKLQYYYHPDHLGSASYITNLDGEVVQHIEYVPFGEVFLEERNNTWNTPFLFNGKEYDSETGLYYYGARYYNPRISLWYGVDPLA